MALEIELEKVQSADEDRILRRYINLIMSMLRTNFYQTSDFAPKPYLSFKLDSQKLTIFHYHVHFEKFLFIAR